MPRWGYPWLSFALNLNFQKSPIAFIKRKELVGDIAVYLFPMAYRGKPLIPDAASARP
jgi:hypothetical protein